MWWLELAAAVATIACVALAVRRSLWQFPVGLLATALYFAVFWRVDLYASASLQIVFMAVQLYGWWFWLRGGADGDRPLIVAWASRTLAGVVLMAAALGLAVWWGLAQFTPAALPLADSLILGLSLGAQFLLDRKVLQHWMLWAVVNVLAIIVYSSQELWLTTALYGGLLLNTVLGWIAWRRAFRAQADRAPA